MPFFTAQDQQAASCWVPVVVLVLVLVPAAAVAGDAAACFD